MTASCWCSNCPCFVRNLVPQCGVVNDWLKDFLNLGAATGGGKAGKGGKGGDSQTRRGLGDIWAAPLHRLLPFFRDHFGICRGLQKCPQNDNPAPAIIPPHGDYLDGRQAGILGTTWVRSPRPLRAASLAPLLLGRTARNRFECIWDFDGLEVIFNASGLCLFLASPRFTGKSWIDRIFERRKNIPDDLLFCQLINPFTFSSTNRK